MYFPGALLLTCPLLAWAQAKQDVYHERSASWVTVKYNHTDAYFGYSITYEPTSKRLIVSAPQGDNIGDIYSCDLAATENQCTNLEKDTSRSDSSMYDHNYWLGATVKAGPSYFVTCAPLYVLRRKFHNRTAVGTFSRCYKYTNMSRTRTLLKTLTHEERTTHGSLFEHAMDSFGWSIDIDDNDVIIGGPAMYTGRVIKYDDRSGATTDFLEGLENEKSNNRRVDFNFGYSVAVGYFKKKGSMKSYAVGSPYGKKGYGMVVFYTFPRGKQFHNYFPYKLLDDLQSDDQFGVGSMFGAVLCAARLQGASRDTTLVVGAPAYAPPLRYNQGAVYFYAPEKKLPLKKAFRKIVGDKDGGFFGSAIAALGDYNGDGLDEIAIAAPYEDSGAGAVYIYSSADITSGKSEITAMQRIVSIDTSMVRSFGLSLSAIQDYYGTGCNELAIGAPESDKVMVLKCMASVTATLKAVIPKDLSLNESNALRTEDHFVFHSCLEVDFPDKPDVIYAHIEISVNIDHPNATLKAADRRYDVFLNRKEQITCKNITVLAPKNGYYQQAIQYKLNAIQVKNPELMDGFNASQAVLSDRSKLTVSGQISLIECKDIEHCKPELNLTKTLSVNESYVIGSPERIKLAMSVTNDGEAAYEACVRVLPTAGDAAVGVVGVPRGCVRLPEQLGALVCRPPGALRKEDQPWMVPEITFDSSRLTSKHKFINISIALFNGCNQNTPAWQETELILLQTDLSKTSIRGITDTGVSNAVYMSKDDVDGKAFEHSYIISNGGLTNLVEVEVTIVRLNQSYIEYGPIIMISLDHSENKECLPSPDNATIFTCVLDKLNSKQSAKITVPMKINSPDSLEIAIRRRRNRQYTSVSLKVNEVELPITSVTSTFNLGGPVKNWIIIVGSLAGLLILLLFFFLLSWRGFFQRHKKARLEVARRTIRRQTIMRQSMTDGARVPPMHPNLQPLLASVPQESSEEAAARDKRVRLDSDATKTKLG